MILFDGDAKFASSSTLNHDLALPVCIGLLAEARPVLQMATWTNIRPPRYYQAMSTEQEFIPNIDSKALGAWIDAVCTMESISLIKLRAEIRKWLLKQNWREDDVASESVLKKVRRGDETAGRRSGKRLHGIWLFLESQPNYVRHRNTEAADASESVPKIPAPELGNKSLAQGFADFFLTENAIKYVDDLDFLVERLAGQFVMFRRYRLRDAGARVLFQASALEISPVDGYVEIKEIQKYEESDLPAVDITVKGVLTALTSDSIIGMMRNVEKRIVRIMILDGLTSFVVGKKHKMGFSGKIIETYGPNSFYRTAYDAFVCVRSDSTDKHGIYHLDDIPVDVKQTLLTCLLSDESVAL